MSNINNQSQDLYSIELVQDLDHEAAATVSGGALYLYSKYNGEGAENVEEDGDPDLGGFDNKASSYKVTGNTDWIAYTREGYKGKKYLLKAGTSGNFKNANNAISSVQPSTDL